MLRRTTTRQVARVYGVFIAKYPDPWSLLAADLTDLETILKPLGLRHRVKQLLALAEKVTRELGGKVPCSVDALKKLPGVGDYAASEVLLTCCDIPVPLLDTNVVRLLARVFGVKPTRSPPYKDLEYYEFVKRLVPEDPELARAFNYGAMDLAREVCKARRPKCDLCPLRGMCLHARLGESTYVKRGK